MQARLQVHCPFAWINIKISLSRKAEISHSTKLASQHCLNNTHVTQTRVSAAKPCRASGHLGEREVKLLFTEVLLSGRTKPPACAARQGGDTKPTPLLRGQEPLHSCSIGTSPLPARLEDHRCQTTAPDSGAGLYCPGRGTCTSVCLRKEMTRAD